MNWLITLAQCTCNGGGGGSGSSSRSTGLLILASFAVLWWLSRLAWDRWITKGTRMSRSIMVAVVVVLLVAGATIIYPKLVGSSATAPEQPRQAETVLPTAAPKPSGSPRLVDLGAGKCIPCKKMAPILEELKQEYAGRLAVEFIDVWVNPDTDLLRFDGQRTIPARRVHGQGRHSGQVEGTRI